MKYTTIVIDKYGKVYDLRYEHPSWEMKRQGKELVNIVVDAFTIPVDELSKYKKLP